MTGNPGEILLNRSEVAKPNLRGGELFLLTLFLTFLCALMVLFLWVTLLSTGGSALGVLGIIFGIYVAAVQVYLGWRFQAVSNKQQESATKILKGLELRIDAKYSNFAEIYKGSVAIMQSASADPKGAVQLALPLYSFGSVHPKTKDGMESKFRSLLCELVRDGREVEIILLDLGGLGRSSERGMGRGRSRDSDSPGLLTRLEMIHELGPEDMVVDVEDNLKHELEAFIEILVAIEDGCRLASDRKSHVKLYWTEFMPLHMVLRGGEESEAVVFVVGAAEQLREKRRLTDRCLRASDVDQFTEGLHVGGGRGSLIFPSFFDRWAADYASDVLAACEPRLLIELARSALADLHNYNEAAKSLQEFNSVLPALDSFRIIEHGEVRVPLYSWNEENATINIVVLPSASGLYGRWRGAGEISRTRFSRYSTLCRRFRDGLKANVFLISQGGQAGCGTWSVDGCVKEVDAVLCRTVGSPENEMKTFLFGICTGGLVSLEFLKRRLESGGASPVAGVLLWDVANKIDFSRRRRERVAKEYHIEFAGDDSFASIRQGSNLARDLGGVAGCDQIPLWIGGVGGSDHGLRERGLSGSRIQPLVNYLREEGFKVSEFSAEDIGHVPGADSSLRIDTAYENFLNSISSFVLGES